MTATEEQWPGGFTGQCHPEVWNEEAKPPQPNEKKKGQLTQEQVDEYFREGVVLIEDYFDPEELEPLKTAIEKLVGFVADRLFEEGKITNKYENEGFYQRLTLINRDFPGANIILHKLGIMPEAVRELWSSDKLCNAVEQLIGPNIGGHPIWNLRTKTPQDEASTVPWHQDAAYMDTLSYNKHIVGAWIPLLDTSATNGCMEFALGGHKKGMVANHECCDGNTHYVMLEPQVMADSLDVDLKKDLKVIPVKYGSLLLFNNVIPHRSLNNLTGFPGEIRWSLDLRWQNYQQDWGFFGLAKGITFRKGEEPDWRPQAKEWEEFLNLARRTKYEGALDDDTLNDQIVKESFSLDTTIVGPWMKNWELTNMNKHTEVMTDELEGLWRKSISENSSAA